MSSRALSGSLDALRLRVETSASIVDSALDCIITIDGSGRVRASIRPLSEPLAIGANRSSAANWRT